MISSNIVIMPDALQNPNEEKYQKIIPENIQENTYTSNNFW